MPHALSTIANAAGATPHAENASPGMMRLARVDDLHGDGPFALSVASTDLAVARRPDGWIAVSGLCPHQGALLGEGELDGDELVCRNHGWRFDLATGQRRGGSECLARFPIREEEGWLWVDLRASKADDAAKGSTKELRTFDDLPGPSGWPFVGSALQIDPNAAHLQVEAWSRQYGPVYGYRFGSMNVVSVADPELMSACFNARPETFRRFSPIEEVFRELGIHGTFSAEGESWRVQRRLTMMALAQRTIRAAYPSIADIAGSLLRRWGRAADDGRELDIADEMMRFTVDVTTSLAFSHNVGALDDTDDPLQEDLSLVLPALNRRVFALVPYWRWFRLPRDRALERGLARVRTWVDGTIAEAKERLEADPSRREAPQNFIEAMLTARDEHGEPFDAETIYANAITILVAGEDTTANTLAWAVHELLDAPRVVEALRDHLDEQLGIDPYPKQIEAALGLPYASAVVDETMRLRPVAPITLNEANVDTVIGDIAIRKGEMVQPLSRPAMLDPARVADPTTFRPERWLDAQFVESIREARAFVPFGSGPRICPGRNLALLEARIVLATLYKNFDVERVGDAKDVKEHMAFTMAPVGLRARLHRRS